MPDIFVAARAKKSSPFILESNNRRDNAISALSKIDHKLVKHKKSFLSAFLALPSKARFETQQLDEPIILVLRRHWITNIPWIIGVIVMILVPFVPIFSPIISYMPLRFQWFFVILWYLLTTSFLLEKFLSWFFNIYIITDERVVDVDFYSLIYKQISDAGLDKIQDVTYRTGGFLGTIINYGDILIQTAGTQENIQFEKVPQPAKVVSILNELIYQEQQDMLDGKAR
jgi:uncharacterized membrane protein YdbT with pleckstrin-like domain